ncbi:MAG TPA: secondary thiamine-phosphate synthase enzyme YjbQ [Verrucomicrobiae bacterium]|jgi:secondary thiamine-phosphate synthase enzyme|nr:secondary thiamine-phosphate synthase enzyme YjbQ [Verrucomicrobiae bacterium]
MKAKSGEFKVENYSLELRTQGFCDIHDITDAGREKVASSGIQNGQAVFFAVGSTAGMTTVEYEPGLIQDLKVFFEKMAPQNEVYHHEETWHDGNGFSHVRASFLKPSVTVPVVDGKLALGTWQQVVYIDFDNRPRTREVIVQVLGV